VSTRVILDFIARGITPT